MKTDINGFDVALQQVINGINSKVEEAGKAAMWEALKEIKPLAQQKIREIIWEKFYNNPDIPSSEYYDRTYQFANALEVGITQGHGSYVLSLFYAPLNIHSNSTGEGHRPPKGKFWSYAFSWGNESVVGRPLKDAMLVYVMDNILADIDDRNAESVEEAFAKWAETTFYALYEQKFSVRVARIRGYD